MLYNNYTMIKTLEFKGSLVVSLLLMLTALVGGLFIVLGPKATERSPGVVHIGVRYANEISFECNQYSKNGPGATIELVTADNKVVYIYSNLRTGRNLMPLKDVADGPYIAKLSAPGYQTREVPIIVQGRMINPPKGAQLEDGTLADYNMIGVHFEVK